MIDSKVCLISFDTDRVKDYIFATPDLKKIRGASALLETLNQKDTPEIIQNTCLNAGYNIPVEHIIKGGGTAMAIVPTTNLAQHVITAVERTYRQKTINGTITGVYLEIPEADLSMEAFGRRVAEVGAKLRQAKDSKGYEPALPLTAYLRPCNGCGRYPSFKEDPDDPAQALCHSCGQKYEWSRPTRNHFWNEFKDVVRELDGPDNPWLQLNQELEVRKDLGAIGRISRPPGYVGFILADGNRMGSLLREMPSFSAYRGFATRLDKLVREVTYGALLDALRQPRQDIAPFEILLVGGDDLMLVVAADAALEVALKITEDFETRANQLAKEIGLSEYLSLSAGVVIAHERFPIKAMHDVAADLLMRAKRASSQADNAGMVDFMVITEAATAGVEVVRDKVLTHQSFAIAPSPGEKFALTERPYTAVQLRELLNSVREFKQKGFPTGTLQTMYEALFQSEIQAQLVTLTALTRAKQEHRELMRQFFDLSDDTQPIPYVVPPWRQQKAGQFSTRLGDLVEIYPFVRLKTD